MAKKVEIELDVKGNIIESTKNLRALKTELKNVAAGTAEWNKIKNDIRDIEDALESAGQSSEDFKGLLENAPGPLGVLGGAIKKVELATKSWGAALKATGIGLLVALIGGLVAAFSQTEGSLKKLEPLLIGMEKIFGGIVEMAQPLLDLILDLGLKALPFVTDAFKNVYSAVFAVFQSLGKLGQAVGKLIKGDFTGAWETAKESVTKFGENFEINQKNFEKGAKKMTKTQKENLDKQKEDSQKALDEKLKRMEAEDKLDEAKMEKMKAEALALAKTEQQKLDVEKAFADKLYQLRLAEANDKIKLYKKDSVEYKAIQAEKIKLDTEYINTTTANKEKQKEITDKANKDLMDAEVQALNLKKAQGDIKETEYQESLYQIKKKYTKDKKELVDIEIAYEQYKTNKKKELAEIERSINLSSLQDEMNTIDRLNKLFNTDLEADNERYKLKRQKLAEAEKLELLAVENNEIERNKILQKYSDLRKGIDQEQLTNTQETERARVAAKQKALDDIILIAGAETDIGRAALIAKQILMAKELVMEISRTITFSTQAAARSVVAVAEGTAQTAKIGFPQNIPMLIGYAAQAFAIISAIKSAVSSAKGSASTSTSGAASAPPSLGKNYGDGGMIEGPLHAGGGVMINAEGGEAVISRGAVSMFKPMLSVMNQMGGGTSFTKGASGQASYDNPKTENQMMQPQIIKTYVVSSEMTSEQERQGRLKDLSTI